MTLATRCPACGTVFRVVQDQLRVSQGWVRCGRCSEAFNALEAMVDWPSARAAVAPGPLSPTPDDAPSTVAPAPVMAAPAVDSEPQQEPSQTAEVTAATAATAPDIDPGEQGTSAMPPASPDATPAEPVREAVEPRVAADPATPWVEVPPDVVVIASDGAPHADLRWSQTDAGADRVEPAFGFEPPPTAIAEPAPEPADEAALAPPVAPLADPAAAEPLPVPAAAAPPAPAHPPAPQAAPSFVIQAERAARWRRPGVRWALGVASLLAGLGLAAQITHAYRDRLAAGSPGLRPLLLQACAAIGCRVGEYRQIEALSVESSALMRVDGAPVYRLAVTLRNRAAVEVAAPALDLVLNDAQGQPVARRVLQMSDLNLPLRSLKPGSELPIQVPLGIAGPVSGYTVEIFYP